MLSHRTHRSLIIFPIYGLMMPELCLIKLIRDPVTWNLMIDGNLSSNRIDEAGQMLNEMPEQTAEA